MHRNMDSDPIHPVATNSCSANQYSLLNASSCDVSHGCFAYAMPRSVAQKFSILKKGLFSPTPPPPNVMYDMKKCWHSQIEDPQKNIVIIFSRKWWHFQINLSL